MLKINSINEMKMVSESDVKFVNGLADRFRHSGDPEEHRIGLIVDTVLERLGLKENAPEAATSKGNIEKYTLLL